MDSKDTKITEDFKSLRPQAKSIKDLLIEENQKLLLKFDDLREHFKSKISNASIFAILQDSPCRLKCVSQICQQGSDDSSIDSFYFARHDWVRKIIIEAIIDKFGQKVEIRSEHKIPNGRLDIVLIEGKIIAIEIKGGNWLDSNTFNQMHRYLIGVDLLLKVRVPNESVDLIDPRSMNKFLIKHIRMLNRKAQAIMANELTIVRGDWCQGCNALCEYKKPPRFNGKQQVSFSGHEQFVMHLDIVVEKIMAMLEKELQTCIVTS